jgi:rod shape-determining protein MreD
MSKKIARNRWFIVLTFLIALMLDVLPLPGWVIWLRPQWTLLVLIYWVMALPSAVGIISAFSVGILLDLLNNTLLGEHAFAMVIIAYVVIKLHKLIRVYPLLQQMLVVFVFVLLYQLIIFGIQGIIGQLPHTFLYWLTVFISTILWPWVFVLLRDCRRRFYIN